MLVESGNLRIRNATPADAGLLADWWNDGSVMAHAGFPYGIGISSDEIAESLITDTEAGRRLIIEADGLPIGEMSYRTVAEQTAEIGIKICDPEHQERGFGTRLLIMLIGSLFRDLGFVKIVLDTNLDNRRAQHVYRKLGFRQTRIRRDAWRDQTGVWQSAVDYELTAEEFAANQSSGPTPDLAGR